MELRHCVLVLVWRHQLAGGTMNKVKYRLNNPRLAPRRTKLEIPGWAGKRDPRANGSQ